jgi:hypothetical protein
MWWEWFHKCQIWRQIQEGWEPADMFMFRVQDIYDNQHLQRAPSSCAPGSTDAGTVVRSEISKPCLHKKHNLGRSKSPAMQQFNFTAPENSTDIDTHILGCAEFWQLYMEQLCNWDNSPQDSTPPFASSKPASDCHVGTGYEETMGNDHVIVDPNHT